MKRFFNQLLILVALTLFSIPIFSQTTLINYGSSWDYYDNQNEPAVQGSNDWNDSAFDSSSWSSGNAHLGYGDGDEATVLNSNTLTAYFRHSFNVSNPSAYTSLNLNLIYDDGAVIYLNGTEVWRVNMPTGPVNYNTFTPGISSDNASASTTISDALISGNNILAVEIHQASSGSSDISFDFKLSGNAPGSVNVSRGPYLQKGTPSSMVIKWRTASPTESVVDYGTSLGNLTQSVSDLSLKTEHEIEITGLASNSIYYYQISNSSAVLVPEASDMFFKTHPTVGSSQPFTFWALGDCGTANNDQRAVRDAYYSYIGSNITDGILFLGDNAYNDGTDSEYQLALFENMYENKLKNSVSWSTLGNHDGHSADSNSQTGPYYDIFTFPTAGESGGMASGTEAYYSFDYGNVHFIVLESYETDRSVGGAMYNWAQSDIQNTTQEWIIAFWHHPPYTKGSHNSDTESQLIDMRQNFLPMLESNGVDLVLAGHSHSYERSYFLNGHYGTSGTFNSTTHTVGANGDGDGKTDGSGAYFKSPGDPEGAVYITAGSSGKISGGNLNHNAMYASLNQLGSCILEVDGDTLNLKFIRETGAIDDYFTIQKGCTQGTSCDDGDPCTTNDVYDANCGCAGTPEPDSDGDGVCDAEDQCPGFDDNVDTNGNGIPDGCDSQCLDYTANFSANPLTHSGSGSGSTTLVFPADSQDVSFTISDIDQKLNGKPSRKYIERVVVTFIDENNTNQTYGTYSGASVSSVFIDIQEIVKSVTVALSDELDGNTSSNMSISFSTVDYCVNNTQCDDDDGDGVCNQDDQCPGFDDNLLGTSCDDGDVCTTGETYGGGTDPCGCGGGLVIDSDNDGICDAEDSCPNLDNSLIGTSCDDGDPCTSNDVYTVDCDCEGTPEPDSDGDGVCDAEDQCPGQDDALIGTSCEDGDPCTTGETYDSNCNCSGGVYTDADGDGVCIGNDPDDNDGCVPDNQSPTCNPCGDITNDSFESGFGNWNDGGNDCARVTTNPNTGSYSIRLRDNSGNASSIYSNNLDLTSVTGVTFDFSYYPVGMENGEDLLLEYSTNGGSSYSLIQSWVSGTHFNNNTRYNVSVDLSSGYSFSANTVFRIRCDASNNKDNVYIDDVVINGCQSQAPVDMDNNLGETASPEDSSAPSDDAGTYNEFIANSIIIYPNPASADLFVDYGVLEDINANFLLFDVSGRLIRNVVMNNQNSQMRIDLDGISNGLYLIKITDQNGQIIKTDRVVVDRR